MKTIDKLKRKAEASLSDRVRMPSISEIEKMLAEMEIPFHSYESTNIVEHRSVGNRYVNSRHAGKVGKKLTINILPEEQEAMQRGRIELDTSDSYYSANSWSYAKQILKLLTLRGKI